MFYRIVSGICVLGGVVTLGVAALAYFNVLNIWSSNSGVYVEEPERTFADWDKLQDKTTVFRIHNPTGRMVRVVGLSYC
jgi:hypothetical protein